LHQWYWEYEYADFLNEENETINFDSYMKDESSLEEGELRMLDVDNSLVLPIDTHIRFIVTAADVLHDWAMPTLALKVDACPGRLNQASVIIERPGFFYGQCSEICLRLGRLICSGKVKSSLVFPSTRLSIKYDVGLCELSLKYIQRFLNLWILGAYIDYKNIITPGLRARGNYIFMPGELKTPEHKNIISKIIVELILFERSLTCNWDSSGCVSQKSYFLNDTNKNDKNLCVNIRKKDLKTKNIFKQKGILISEVNKVFWLTEIKNAVIQSANWSKLGNPVFRIIIMITELKHYSNLQLYGKSWIEESIYRASRGQDRYQDNHSSDCTPGYKIMGFLFPMGMSFLSRAKLRSPGPMAPGTRNNDPVIKRLGRYSSISSAVYPRINYLNYRAYSIWSKLNWRLQDKDKFKYWHKNQFIFWTIFRKYSSVNTMNNIKPLKDKKLTKEIMQTLREGKWITTKQKQKLTIYIENVQKSISETALYYGMYSKKLNYLTESFLHSLLVQVYAIEVLSKNKGSRTPGSDNLILDHNYENKMLILSKVKKFYSIEKIPGKRVYVPKFNSKELRPLTIPSIIDRAIQQLFLIVMDPIIDVNSDLYSFGFRKGRNQIMAIGHIQKKLQTKPSRGKITQIDYPYIWDADIRKCFDSINHDWLLNNIPLGKKYKRIFKKWLRSGYIEFGSENIHQVYEGIPQGGIISPLLMNMTLNGIEKLIEEAKLEYKKKIKRSVIRRNKYGKCKLAVKMKSKVDNKFKEVEISCDFIRFADDFIIICGSSILLDIIKRKTKEFLKVRGLEIHPNKSRTLYFKINVPFNFLGYTFVYLIRTNHIRSKFLMRYIREYRLKGIPRLYVYPSSLKYNNIKLKIKEILKSNYNTTVFQLISKLNPIIRGWVNYYSFSNSGGTLTSFRKFMFERLKIYLIKKHKKASIIWLMRQYFLINTLPEQYNLKPKILLKINSGILKNKWNFYALAFKDESGNLYDKPKINILLWPNKIKRLVTATIFAPNRELLGISWYLKKELWNIEMIKLQKYHFSFNISLWEALYKRDGNVCYLCKDILIDDMNNMNNDVHIHHINSWSNNKSYASSNLALVHANCHTGWHLEVKEGAKKGKKSIPDSIPDRIRISHKSEITKYAKNRTKIRFKE